MATAAANPANFRASPAYEAAVDEYKKAQLEMQKLVAKRQQFDAQQRECDMVKGELDALREGEHVYKVFGRVMVRQDPGEAKATVASRLKFIHTELQKTEASITKAEERAEAARTVVMKMQQEAAKARVAAM